MGFSGDMVPIADTLPDATRKKEQLTLLPVETRRNESESTR
jgi:hypothetical protein